MESLNVNTFSSIEEKQALFMRLLKQNNKTVWNVLKTFSFINSWEYDDCMQEIKMYAWEKFDHFLKNKHEWPDFGSWLYLRGRKAVYRHYFKLTGVSSHKPELLWSRNHRFVEIDENKLAEIADVEYDETDLYHLNKAIESLPEKDKEIVTRYLNGERLLHMAREDEGTDNLQHYSWKLSKIKKALRAKLEQAIDYKRYSKPAVGERTVAQRAIYEKKRKSIYQVDFNGIIIRKWESAQEAANVGSFNFKGISGCCTGRRKTYAGYLWFYSHVPLSEIEKIAAACNTNPNIRRPSTNERIENWQGVLTEVANTLNVEGASNLPGGLGEGKNQVRMNTNIIQTDLSGKEVKRWDSIKEAVMAGYAPDALRDAIYGHTEYANSLWVKVGVEVQSNRHRCHALTVNYEEKDPTQAEFFVKPQYSSSDIYNHTQ